MPEAGPEVTATRATLDPSWIERQKKLDWMHAPEMADYVNGLVSGRRLHEGGHWAQYACEKFVTPLLKDQDAGKKLSMVSLGCGDGHIERALIGDFQWPVSRFVGLDYDAELRRAANTLFGDMDIETSFQFIDFNNPNISNNEKFDIVFTCHAIHHATNLEVFLPFINSLLKPNGIFIGIDYFGPTRFQVEFETRSIIDALDVLLPPEIKVDLRTPLEGAQPIRYATVDEVRSADISEAVRSSDLRTMLFSNFEVLEIKPMGGTLLRWLLQYRSGNFNAHDQVHVSIARLLAFIEGVMITKGQIRSDDLFFVLQRSTSL